MTIIQKLHPPKISCYTVKTMEKDGGNMELYIHTYTYVFSFVPTVWLASFYTLYCVSCICHCPFMLSLIKLLQLWLYNLMYYVLYVWPTKRKTWLVCIFVKILVFVLCCIWLITNGLWLFQPYLMIPLGIIATGRRSKKNWFVKRLYWGEALV